MSDSFQVLPYLSKLGECKDLRNRKFDFMQFLQIKRRWVGNHDWHFLCVSSRNGSNWTSPVACRHQPPGTGVKFQSFVENKSPSLRSQAQPFLYPRSHEDLTFALDNTAEGHVASLPLLGSEEARSFAGLPCKWQKNTCPISFWRSRLAKHWTERPPTLGPTLKTHLYSGKKGQSASKHHSVQVTRQNVHTPNVVPQSISPKPFEAAE